MLPLRAAKARLEELQDMKRRHDAGEDLQERALAKEVSAPEEEDPPEETPENPGSLPKAFLEGQWTQDAQPPPVFANPCK